MGSVIQLNTALQRAQFPATPAPRPATMLHPYQWAPLPTMVPPSVQEAALLLTTPDQYPARAMSTDELIEALFEPLAVVPMLLGHSKSLLKGADLLLLATAVAEMVQRHFPAFRVGEIGLALRRGCSGEWKKEDEVELVALPTFRKWLQAYHNGSRATAINLLAKGHEQLAQKLLAPPPINYPQQIAELAAWVTDNATPEHPAGRFPEPLDQGNVLYTWLKKVGAFNGFLTWEKYVRMRWKESLHRAQRPPSGLEEYRQGRTFWALLRAGKWQDNHPFADSVVNGCRKRLLREWMYYHLGRGTDLLTWLTELSHNAQSV